MNMFDVMAKAEDAGVVFLAEGTSVDEFLLVRQMSVGMNSKMTSFLERLSTVASVLSTSSVVRFSVVGLHVILIVALGFIELVALSTLVVSALVMALVMTNDSLHRSKELTTGTRNLRRTIMNGFRVNGQETHFVEFVFANVALKSV